MAKRTISTRIAIEGEAQYKQSITNINAEIKKYGSALDLVESKYKTNANSMEALTAKQKALSDLHASLTAKADKLKEVFKKAGDVVDNYKSQNEELNKKITANEAALEKLKNTEGDTTAEQKKLTAETDKLKKELAENEANLKLAEKGANNWQTSLNKAQTELNKTNGEIKKNDKYLGEAKNSTDKTAKSIDNLGNETKKSGSKIKEFALSTVGQMASIAGAFALAKQAVSALWDIINDATNAADALITLSNQTGIATDKLQEYAYAARFVDVEVEMMTKGLSRVVMAINEAKTKGDEYIETAGGLKISITDANGALKDSEQLFYEAIDAIGGLASETEREAAAQDIFGRSYQDIMPLIKAGSGAIKGYGKEAKDAGIIVDTLAVRALGRLDDKLEEVAASSEAMGTKLAASMVRVTDWTANAWQDILKFIDPVNKAYEEGIDLIMQHTGVTREAAMAIADQNIAIDNVSYITGLSLEEVRTKADELSQYLVGQGVDANTAYYDALVYVADGVDAVSLAQQQMTEAQAVWDAQVTAAVDNYIAKRAEYETAVKETSQAYLSDMGGLFDGFDAGLADSQEELDNMTETMLGNLQSQVTGIEGWSGEMERLSKRGIDEGLLQELRDMGPDAYAQIQALNNMTDDELIKYEGLYKKRSEAAREAAKTALEPMAADVDLALKDVEKVIADKNATMEKLGKDLAYGIGDGIDSGTWYVKQSAKKAVDAAVAAAKKAGKIESPSKLMRDEVGLDLGRGTGVGWVDGVKEMSPKIEESLKSTAKASAKNISIEATEAVRIANAEIEKVTSKIRKDYNQKQNAVKQGESGQPVYNAALAANDAYAYKMKQVALNAAPVMHNLSGVSQRQIETPARSSGNGDVIVNVYGDGMIVRNESDIKKISQQLATEAQRKIRAKGGKVS